MNRLTKRTKGGIAYTEIPLNQSSVIDKDGYIVGCRTGFIADRLAAYEDTRLEPEQVKQLNDAFKNSQKKLEKAFDDLLEYEKLEEQGLLIKLPCKVDSDVYLIHNICNGKWTSIEKVKFKINLYNCFGKTVFLTREEAEKTLKIENE